MENNYSCAHINQVFSTGFAGIAIIQRGITDAVNNMKDVRYYNVHFHYILMSYRYRISIIQDSISYGAHIFKVILNFMHTLCQGYEVLQN